MIARIDVMICCSGRRMLSAMTTPATMMIARKDRGDRQHRARDVGQRLVERHLRPLLALPHLDRQTVDRGDGLGLAGVDGVAQQIGALGELLGQSRNALAQRGRPGLQPLQRVALQIVVGKIDHFRNGLRDRLGIPAGLVGKGEAGER